MKCTCGHNLSEHFEDVCVFMDDTIGSDHKICKCITIQAICHTIRCGVERTID